MRAIAAKANEDEVTRLMIGRSLRYERNHEHVEPGDEVLAVRGLSCGSLFNDISFGVRRGEVVGFYVSGADHAAIHGRGSQ